jgi:hypothetical protein
MSAITLSLGETHGPAWAARARNTGGSRRPVTKRYRSAYGLGGSSRNMRRLALIPRLGVSQTAAQVGVPHGGGVRSLLTRVGVGGRLGGDRCSKVFVFGSEKL